MIRQVIRRLILGLVIGCVLLGSASCRNVAANIPQNIVVEAVTLTAQRKQSKLWQQLSSDVEAAPTLSIRKVHVEQVRKVQVAADLAYEIVGTYQAKLRYPNHSPIKQSDVPFSLILQGDDEQQVWQLLQIDLSSQGDRAWHWEPLTSDSA